MFYQIIIYARLSELDTEWQCSGWEEEGTLRCGTNYFTEVEKSKRDNRKTKGRQQQAEEVKKKYI